MIKISPSVLGADFLDLAAQLKIFEKLNVDMLHIDVMDGIFVPNISFGVPIIKSIRNHTSLKMDVHLMIDRPHRYIESFAPVSDILGFHYEAGSPVKETLQKIKAMGVKTCLTIKPKTDPQEIFPFLELCDMILVMSVEPGFGGQSFMPSSLKKLTLLKEECLRRGLFVDLEIDGGINHETAALAAKAGATVLVAGNYLFNSNDLKGTLEYLKSL
ncbi:MAG: ribulose-phosphate 3-epimerase [Oscillospiraceae bacterium]